MYRAMDHWTEIRRRVLTERLSKRRACEEYGIHWKTLEKMLEYPEPPGYRCEVSRPKPKLDPYLELIEQILEADKLEPPKQRHTAQRIYERLKAEHGFTGGESTVREAVRKCKRQTAEVFVPLSHPPGEAQMDFGHAQVIIAGERVSASYLVMTLPYSDAFFCCVFPKECTETFQEGHVRAFEFFGGVPLASAMTTARSRSRRSRSSVARNGRAGLPAWSAITCINPTSAWCAEPTRRVWWKGR